MGAPKITATPAWQALAAHRDEAGTTHLRDLFAADSHRFERLSLAVDDLLFDFSKQRVTPRTIELLGELAQAADLDGWRARLFAGDRVNTGENRAALHVALRATAGETYRFADHDVVPDVLAERARMRELCERVRGGRHAGFSGVPVRHIVNLGIGGSDLGPRMATTALAALAHPALTVDFVANVDGADLAGVLERLDPRATLVIVASKTFTTLETLANAQAAREWLLEAAGDARDAALAAQFVGVTANPQAAREFGIVDANIFAFADWVGGRFSLWSPIGLPLALAIGSDDFEALLTGARRMDQHFRDAPWATNMPVLLALLGIWNIDFLGATALSVAPYSQALRLLPDYLQQLEMESNGKSVDRDGERLDCATAPVIFGGAGTNTQHAYFQMLHQGTRLIPSDFIAVARSEAALPGHHEQLLANCLAQSAALAFGTADETGPLRQCPGNQPSSTLLLPRLDPHYLGMLLALYEHKTFVQGVVWGLNPFDQWGVELGKRLARRLLPLIGDASAECREDASTCGLAAHMHRLRERG